MPLAIIDWDGTQGGTRCSNLADFLWAFVHPALYGDGEPSAHMLRVATDAYGWNGDGLVDAMLTTVRTFNEVNPEAIDWGGSELAHLERNEELLRVRLG
jgi:hypothetical protein